MSEKSLSFPEILRGQIPSKIPKNNSQGIIFVMISYQRVVGTMCFTLVTPKFVRNQQCSPKGLDGNPCGRFVRTNRGLAFKTGVVGMLNFEWRDPLKAFVNTMSVLILNFQARHSAAHCCDYGRLEQNRSCA